MATTQVTDSGQTTELKRDEVTNNPSSLHDFHANKRGPKGVPVPVEVIDNNNSQPKDPGHSYANTEHISFELFDQRETNAPFGYEHFVSLPPKYNQDSDRQWPLILFLHGAGESQRSPGESSRSIRHGIPKMILCYDRLRSGKEPAISVPLVSLGRKAKQSQNTDLSSEPASPEACKLLAENFITVSPSLDMNRGYGWNAPILSALFDEILGRYRIDENRVHITGFSMGGYGTWDLAMHTPERFASIVPICGGGNVKNVSRVRHIPHWVCHGEQDDIIPIKASQQMVDALKAAGSKEIRFTRLPNTTHDSWTATYNNSEIYRWILNHRKESYHQ